MKCHGHTSMKSNLYVFNAVDHFIIIFYSVHICRVLMSTGKHVELTIRDNHLSAPAKLLIKRGILKSIPLKSARYSKAKPNFMDAYIIHFCSNLSERKKLVCLWLDRIWANVIDPDPENTFKETLPRCHFFVGPPSLTLIELWSSCWLKAYVHVRCKILLYSHINRMILYPPGRRHGG